MAGMAGVGAGGRGVLVGGVMGAGWEEEAQAVRTITISTQNSQRFAVKHLDISSSPKSSTFSSNHPAIPPADQVTT
jgi:hypothetical protein